MRNYASDDYEMSDEELQELLFSELGKFVVEYEGLVQTIKDSIGHVLQIVGNYDTIPVDILTFNSESYTLANKLKGASHYALNKVLKGAPDTPFDAIGKTRNFINATSKNIIEAAELRNDLVHASWVFSSLYGANPQLEANRIKIAKQGIEMRKLSIQPDLLEVSRAMLNTLSGHIYSIFFIIDSPKLNYWTINDCSDLDTSLIDFVAERERLFMYVFKPK